jgi:hypothetical protein
MTSHGYVLPVTKVVREREHRSNLQRRNSVEGGDSLERQKTTAESAPAGDSYFFLTIFAAVASTLNSSAGSVWL